MGHCGGGREQAYGGRRRLGYFPAVVVCLAIIAAPLSLLSGGSPAAATPASAVPAAPTCGVADQASIGGPAGEPSAGKVTVLAAGFRVSALASTGSMLVALDAPARTVRQFDFDGTLRGSFTVPWDITAQTVAVDPDGKVFLARHPSTLVKVSAAGVELWARDLSSHVDGIYSVGAGAGFRVGAVIRGTPGSSRFTGDGTPDGTSEVTGVTFSPAPNGGLVATDGRYVRLYSPEGQVQRVFGDARGASDQQMTGGPYRFFQQGGAVLGPEGSFYVADASRGIHAASPEGFYKGRADDAALGGLTERAWLVPAGDRLIFAGGGPFSTNQNVSSILFSDLAGLVATPKRPDPVLGFGAGLVSSAVGHYFPYGSAPAVSATFDGWWASPAPGLSLHYTVRERKQVVAGEDVPVAITPLPTSAEQLASVRLETPAARPGAYEVDARLVDSAGAVVGSTCLHYTVGAPGHRLDFTSLPEGIDYGGSAPRRRVVLADQLGMPAVRVSVEFARLLPDPNGPMDFSAYDPVLAEAAQEAANRGVALFVLVGHAMAADQTLVREGRWEERVKELVSHYRGVVRYWEAWSEPNNNFGTAADLVTQVLAPFHRAVRAADPAARIIGGSVLGMDLPYFDALGQAGAYELMDIVGLHPYAGHNRAIEEHGIPRSISSLREILATHGASALPIWNTESAWWSDGPGNYYSQANKAARTMLWNRALGIDQWSYLIHEGGYGDYGLTYSFIQAASGIDYVKPAALAAMTAAEHTAGRPFLGLLETGIPHVFAAQFGSRPGSTDRLIAAWSDDLDVTVNLVATASTTASVTDVLGDAASLGLTGGLATPLRLSGAPSYVVTPDTATLRLESQDTFGRNLAAAVSGATAAASSALTTNAPSGAIDGVADSAEGGNLNGVPTAWVSAPGDDAPVLTVSLGQAVGVDRVLLSTHSNGSIAPGLRDYSVEVRSPDGAWTTVATVQDQFFNRMALLRFPARTATGIRITVTKVNYGGYTGGSVPWFWPGDAASLSDPSAPWYGPAVVYELEAYGPGSPPPPPTGLVAPAASSDQINMRWDASAGATSYKVERSTDSTAFTSIGSTTETNWADLGLAPSTTYYYRVKAVNEFGESAPSNTASNTTRAA